MRKIVTRLNLLRSSQAEKAALTLSRAGWRGPDALNVYFFSKLCLPFVFDGAAAFALFVAQLGAFTTPIRLVIAPAAVIAGAYAPEIFISNAATKRKKELPRACRMHSICW